MSDNDNKELDDILNEVKNKNSSEYIKDDLEKNEENTFENEKNGFDLKETEQEDAQKKHFQFF